MMGWGSVSASTEVKATTRLAEITVSSAWELQFAIFMIIRLDTRHIKDIYLHRKISSADSTVFIMLIKKDEIWVSRWTLSRVS